MIHIQLDCSGGNRIRKSITLKSCDQNIKATFQLVEKMIALANRGDADREDAGCGVLYGVLRDAAYRVKKLAEQEKQTHISKGWWNEDSN